MIKVALKNQDFEMYQGETKRITFKIKDDEGKDKNLVGCSAQ